MEISETTNRVAYHIIAKNGEYYVYSPKFVRKGKYVSLKQAYLKIEKLNAKTRFPIYEQDSQGKILAINYAKNIKRIAVTDTEKKTYKRVGKKLRVLSAR